MQRKIDRHAFFRQRVAEAVPFFTHETDAKTFDRVVGETALFPKIRERAFVLPKDAFEVLERELVDAQKPRAPRSQFFFLFAFFALGENHARFVREKTERFHEVQGFDLFDELESVAAGVAAETMVELLGRIDVKRSRFLGMEGTKADQPSPFLSELYVATDHAFDVHAHSNFIDHR